MPTDKQKAATEKSRRNRNDAGFPRTSTQLIHRTTQDAAKSLLRALEAARVATTQKKRAKIFREVVKTVLEGMEETT